MARALLGYVGSTDQSLSYEVARLRRRVAELEAELAEIRAADRARLDLELHRIADVSHPALT